jgi:hypothetical protein
MSAMRRGFLQRWPSAPALALLAVGLAAPGCVREVLKGEDPEAQPGRLTGENRRDALVVRLPWMQAPPPRLLRDGQPARSETVYGSAADGVTRYTLREPSGASAMVDVRSKMLPEGALEFAYEVVRLPPGLALEVAVPTTAEGARPAATVTVNGAPAVPAAGERGVLVPLGRDGTTRIVATPKAPETSPEPSPAPAAASVPAAGTQAIPR